MEKQKDEVALNRRFPPSEPCGCDVCRGYCARPGWWTVAEAERAMNAGYARRMMLELSPELTFGVLSPAFRGCEGNYALQIYAGNGCTFLQKGLCALHGTGLEPLECLYCHHERKGLGQACHTALEADWRTAAGQKLVLYWVERHLCR